MKIKLKTPLERTDTHFIDFYEIPDDGENLKKHNKKIKFESTKDSKRGISDLFV